MDTIFASDRPLEQLEAQIHQGAANLTAFERDWLLAVAEFDRREGWKLWECQSCAAWLSWRVGLDIRAAHEKVRVARALERFPVIAAAMATGQVSYSKVRAITRIATPECEQALVDMALAGTTNHVERIVSAYRRAEPIAVEREQLQHARRSLFHRVDDDGSVVITVRLPAEAGATVLSAIEHLVAPSVAEPDGTRDPLSARRADALVDLAIAGHAASDKPGSATRYLAYLHLSQSALSGGDGRCEIHGHGDSLDQPIGISIDTALRMLCDADIDIVLAHEVGNTKNLGHRQGVVRGIRRREVEQRDEHRCQIPGCSRRGKLEVHHIKHRAHKGNNTLPNLTMLCRFHHHRLHEGGWTAVRTPDGLELHDPHGRRICSRPPIATGDGHRSRSPQSHARRRSLPMGRRATRHQHGPRRPLLPHPHFPGSLEALGHMAAENLVAPTAYPDYVADDLDRALQRLTGRPGVVFRDGQREAVEALAVRRERVLLVQRTGWGKSAVYFLATRLLRDAGFGPTLLISPLLALMRNQLEAAARLGLRAYTVNSASATKVSEIGDLLERDEVDLLLISPERLANPEFGDKVMPLVGGRPGLIVIDEAHCISDWGHDFRPDYRRLGQMIDGLPGRFPVLGCTATANDRVVDDVATQLGVTMNVLRGPLTRDGLSLQVIDLPDAAERLCWLDQHLYELPGSGIIYCLTVDDTRRVADWLAQRGHIVMAYSGDLENEHRLDAEAALQANEIKALVATTALGMGYDKPDLGFVVHFQAPGSPVAYYQQVGRAGRALDSSVAVLLRGAEDAQIQDWFIQQAFPDERHVDEVLGVFDQASGPVTLGGVEADVNMRHSTLESVLKQLTVEGALTRLRAQTYERTLKPWTYPTERVRAVTAARRAEQQQMGEYATTDTCRMLFLIRLLDDVSAVRCGVCDVCAERRFRGPLDPAEVAAARLFLRQGFITIEPRKRLVGHNLPVEQRFEPGRALCAWGERGWGSLVMAGKHEGTQFDDRFVGAAVDMIGEWAPEPTPTWVAFIPSLRHPLLVADLAHRIGAALGLPVRDVVTKVRNTPQQKGMQNSAHQHANVDGAFTISGVIPPGPVLLVDDLVDSRWTFTEVAKRLRLAGAGQVFPLALASTMGRDS